MQIAKRRLRFVFEEQTFELDVVPDPGEQTVSLVLEGPHLPTSVEVFATQEVGKAGSVPLTALSPEFLLHQMEGVLALPAFARG
jgi:hypothetical protein